MHKTAATRYLTLFRARLTQSTPVDTIHLNIKFSILRLSMPRSPKWSFSFRFLTKVCIILFCPYHLSCPTCTLQVICLIVSTEECKFLTSVLCEFLQLLKKFSAELKTIPLSASAVCKTEPQVVCTHTDFDKYLRSEILRTMKLVFWAVRPCGMKMEAVSSSETLASPYKCMWCYNPGQHTGLRP